MRRSDAKPFAATSYTAGAADQARHSQAIRPKIRRQYSLLLCATLRWLFSSRRPNHNLPERTIPKLLWINAASFAKTQQWPFTCLRIRNSRPTIWFRSRRKPHIGNIPKLFAQAEKFEACNWSRYFARVDELRARTGTPRNLKNVIIPIPKFRPETRSSPPTVAADEPLEQSAQRNVRIVGPKFLPDNNIKFREISNRANERNGLANALLGSGRSWNVGF